MPLIDPDVLNLVELLPGNIEVKLTQRFSAANLLLHKSESIQDFGIDQDSNHEVDSQTGALNVVAQLENLHENKEASFLQTQAKIFEKWNKITACSIENKTCVIDRQSWITKNNKLIKYAPDTCGFPINPMGRTGSRGRGALWRWGPNHTICVIVTRWRKENLKHTNMKYMHVEGKRMLEFLACKGRDYQLILN